MDSSNQTTHAKTPSSNVESGRLNNINFEAPRSRTVIDLDDNEAEQQDELAEKEAPIQYSSAPRSRLRERKPNLSLKAKENADISRQRSRKGGKKRSALSDLIGEDTTGISLSPVVSDRVAIRQEIASKTTANRNRFFIEKKDFWLPLLPQHNYVRKLVEAHEQLSSAQTARLPSIAPYEEIEVQPRGVKAAMKSYQLSGLSFMVWLHRNGLSGILGDEMGLGKTLQTLSLIQYLKEKDPKTGTGRLQRPFLVVCPLSVLSSWMAEARKWTPGLKAIRFHGPVKERTRLKKIVVGEVDMFGNLTAQAKNRLNTRRNAAGKQVILLDSDSEDEVDVGVDLVVTTYECYRAEQSWFKKAFVWRYVVLDEGHTVRNTQLDVNMLNCLVFRLHPL